MQRTPAPSMERSTSGAVSDPILRRRLDTPVVRFAVVGAASTVGYLALYALLRLELPAQAANVLALPATGDVNTVANRRCSLRLQGHAPVHQRAKGVLAYLVSLVATSAALALVELVGADGTTVELTVLAAANLLAGVVHCLLLRRWARAAQSTDRGASAHRAVRPGTRQQADSEGRGARCSGGSQSACCPSGRGVQDLPCLSGDDTAAFCRRPDVRRRVRAEHDRPVHHSPNASSPAPS